MGSVALAFRRGQLACCRGTQIATFPAHWGLGGSENRRGALPYWPWTDNVVTRAGRVSAQWPTTCAGLDTIVRFASMPTHSSRDGSGISSASVEASRNVEREVATRLRAVLHEIQAPILSLRLRIEALAESAAPEMVEKLRDCQAELRQLDRVSRRLLRFDHLGTSAPTTSPVDWVELFSVLRRRFGPIATSGGVYLTIPDASSEELVQAHLVSDSDRIHLILSNLLDNALRHAPAGSTVSVRCSASSDGFRVVVIDQGAGISATELPHLFDPFRRASRPDEDRRAGFGLGLSLCRQAATSLGGHLEIESEDGAGTRAGLFIPH